MMSANWFEILQNVFRNDPESIAKRHQIIDTVRHHVHSMGMEIEKIIIPQPVVEEDIFAEPEPDNALYEKKRLIKKAHLIKELLSKPLALRDDDESY